MKLGEHHREITSELAQHGIKPHIEPTGHNRLRFRWQAGSHSQSLIVGKHQGDPRSTKNNVAKVRRLLRDAGMESVPIAPASHDERIARLEERKAHLEDRVAQLERDVALLLERVTEPPAPEPEPPPTAVVTIANGHAVTEANGHAIEAAAPAEPPPKKRRGRKADYAWLWRAMSYADWRSCREIAAATKYKQSALAQLLTKLKRAGKVQHNGDGGWRKDRSLANV